MDKESLKLNICCGLNKKDGFINIDINKKVRPDVVCDVNHKKKGDRRCGKR